ncbi:TPA: kinase [Candidatus Bathyarchaeota archaeon]|nr:kinase [Candidatus Bathyarchaeota archaeon]
MFLKVSYGVGGGSNLLKEALNFKKAILVTGTPGVGKTEFSKLLAKRLGAVHLDVGKVALKEGFAKAFDQKRETWVVDLEGLREWIEAFLKRASSLVVVDGHYSLSLAPKNQVKKIFVLRCDPLVLRERLRLRGDSEEKILENVAAELLDACLLDALKEYGGSPEKICELEATSKGTSRLVEEALESLNSREGRFGRVDWIGKLSKEGKLNELLSSLSRGG